MEWGLIAKEIKPINAQNPPRETAEDFFTGSPTLWGNIKNSKYQSKKLLSANLKLVPR